MCVFSFLSTPCHLPPAFSPPSPLFSRSLAPRRVVLGGVEAGPESKVQVCRLADESQRGSFPPTVCKYVVTLIEHSSGSQQLSFLSLLLCGARRRSWGPRRNIVQPPTHTAARGRRRGADPRTLAPIHTLSIVTDKAFLPAPTIHFSFTHIHVHARSHTHTQL